MKWIIGLDLRPRSRGALQLAKWLAAATADRGADQFVAVHVLAEDHLRAALQLHHLDEVVEGARAAAQRSLEEAACTGVVDGVEVVQALTAHEGLEEARARHAADGLLVGRAAESHGTHLVRLGRVARRLLRHLPSPVVVAPPDLEAARLGTGPIAALSSLAEDSVEPCRFAAVLATRTARSLTVAHLVRDPLSGSAPYLPRGSLDRMGDDWVAEGERGLARWLADVGLQPGATAVRRGDLLHSALQLAEEQRAPLLVVGARRLSGLDRFFSPSVGRELAAVAPVPVAVVPSRAGGEAAAR
jgi:nucleotide-binding universal stress UspA family protein